MPFARMHLANATGSRLLLAELLALALADGLPRATPGPDGLAQADTTTNSASTVNSLVFMPTVVRVHRLRGGDTDSGPL
jgi:hypothetical protein